MLHSFLVEMSALILFMNSPIIIPLLVTIVGALSDRLNPARKRRRHEQRIGPPGKLVPNVEDPK